MPAKPWSPRTSALNGAPPRPHPPFPEWNPKPGRCNFAKFASRPPRFDLLVRCHRGLRAFGASGGAWCPDRAVQRTLTQQGPYISMLSVEIPPHATQAAQHGDAKNPLTLRQVPPAARAWKARGCSGLRVPVREGRQGVHFPIRGKRRALIRRHWKQRR